MKNILALTFFISLTCYSQWSFKSNKDDFDGNYKTASVYGNGGSFPYTKPLLVLNKFENKQINIYLTGIGYSGCDNRIIYFKFNNDEVIYETAYVSSGSDFDAWFFTSFKNLEQYQFIEKLSKHNSLSVRVISDCNSKDYKFNLNGSTKAINFVLGKDWIENERKYHLNEISIERKKDSLTNVRLDLMIKESKIKDSINKIKKNEQEQKKRIMLDSIKELKLLKINNDYKIKYSDLNYMFFEPVNETTRFFQFMQDIKPKLNLKRDAIIVINKDFVNKVFYKVEEIQGEGKVNYYVLKKEVNQIK
jgi:hypothetical protein